MALLLDQLLLSKADFSSFRDISANISSDKIDIFIREAQTIEVRGFLGQELWYQMQADYNGTAFLSARLNDLWFGVDYTTAAGKALRFNGYMNAAVYFAYNRFLLQQQTNASRFGVESVQNEISQDISDAQVRSKGKDALQVAFAYQNDATVFLTDKKATYPEWYNAEDKAPRKTSTGFFVV